MLQSILEGVPQAGHEFELVFFGDGPWVEELRTAGFAVEVLAAGRLREPHRWLASVVRLARIIIRRRPDLVLNWSAKTQLYGAPAAALAGMRDRVLWWQHEIPSGRGWLDRCASLLPAVAVGCSSASAAKAQRRLYRSPRIFVVSPGAQAPPDESGEPARDAGKELAPGIPIVGLVGRLQPWKGQDRLLAAQALLRERGCALHTLIVGGDSWNLSPGYAASLPRLAERLGLSESVTMTGEVPDAGPYIEQMDVLVNASDPEPFGIVLLEAMARRVAVVAVDSGGPAEFIDDGRTGVLARSSEPDALADALEPLLRDGALRERIALAGRESFRADFTEAALQRRFFAALQGLLGSVEQ
jgi:glycosyltransferase involved in cell wall biosynthesis